MNLRAEREYVRDILAGLIGDDGGAYTYLPERTVLPAWLVTPADPFLSAGQTFKTGLLHLTVTYISTQGSNEVEAQAVDDAISGAVSTLLAHEVPFRIESGTAPFTVSINGATYLAQSIQIAFPIDL